ncbi:MAG: hypothetical protein K9J17_00780 [Flavobacteriales bacterium]|nr:hypothetical protein [Flavobacteriales bacterium]
MRKLILPMLLLSSVAMAQNKITVTEKMAAIDGSSRNSLSVTITGANAEDIKKAWKKQLKDLKGKVSDKTVIFGDDCQAKSMGDNSFDVYSVVQEATDEGVELIVAFDLGGAYLSTANHPDKYPAGEKIVYDFAVEQSKEVVRREIENAGKVLGGFEKELVSMAKDKEGLEKDIADYNKKIEEAQGSIEKNVAAQATKQKEIEGMKAALTELEIKLNAIK